MAELPPEIPSGPEGEPEVPPQAETPERNLEGTPEAREVCAEVERAPEGEREKIGVGLRNVGFFVEEAKDNFFAKTFGWVAKTQADKKGTATRFLSSLAENFEKDAARARERIVAIEGTKHKETLANSGYLFGNILKYGRTVADLAGYTVASPLRYVMMGGMLFSRGAEAAKEARLKNEAVIDKTRIADADRAAEEAWAIYESAKERAGDRPLSAKELKASYREGLPYDLLERLNTKLEDQPHLVNRMVQGVLKFHIGASVKRLDAKLEKIDENKKLSPEVKETARERLLRRYERRLGDYDRMVTQYGTVDALAMGARYAELAGKVAVGVVTVETLLLSLDRAIDGIAKLLTKGEAVEAIQKFGEMAAPDTGHAAKSLITETAVADALKGRVPLDTLVRSGAPLDLLVKAGVSPDTLIKTVSLDTLLGAKVPVDTLLHAGVSPDALVKTVPLDTLIRENVPVDTLLHGGVKPEVLLAHGVSPDSLMKAGVDSAAVQSAIAELAPEVKLAPPGKALEELWARHPEFKGDTTWRVGESGLVVREGYSGWYLVDAKGDIYYSGGITSDGEVLGPKVLMAGVKDWEPTDALKMGPLEGEGVLVPETTIEKGGSAWEAAHGMVARGEVSEEEFRAAWGNPASTLETEAEKVHISKAGLVREGNIIRFVHGEGGKPGHFELLEGKGGKMGTDTDLYNRYRAVGKEPPTWLQESVLGGKAMPPEVEQLPVNDIHGLAAKLAEMPAGGKIKAELPQGVKEYLAASRFGETLPRVATDLDKTVEHFDNYSLAEQTGTVRSLGNLEREISHLEVNRRLLNLSPEQLDYLGEAKEHIGEIRGAYENNVTEFYDRITDTGIRREEYEHLVVNKGVRVKDFLNLGEEGVLPKFKGFLEFLKTLKPLFAERDMTVHGFLASLPESRFLGR